MNNQERRAKKATEVIEYISRIGGTIVGTYVDARTPIEVLCSCGHELTATYNSIKRRGSDELLCSRCHRSSSQKTLEDKEIERRSNSLNMSIKKKTEGYQVLFSCGHAGSMSFSGLKKRWEAEEGKCRKCLLREKNRHSDIEIESFFSKYGCTFAGRSEDKIKLKYACDHTGAETMDNAKKRVVENKSLECGRCCQDKNQSTKSNTEEEVSLFVRDLGIDIKTKFRPDYPRGQEIDVLCRKLDLGIEVDGVYWHSEDKGKSESYHINKKKYFYNMGIDVIFVYDLEWETKRDIVKSIIMSKAGVIKNRIHGRSTTIKKLETAEMYSFLNKNHMQGSGASHNIGFGLYYKEELISVMTFRRKGKNEYELYRFSSKLGCVVIGGFSKLLKHFSLEFTPSKVISYADLRYSTLNTKESVYAKNGFTFSHFSKPNFKYFKNSKILIDRLKFQKHKLKNIFDDFDEGISGQENIKRNGYNRIFDCGNAVYILKPI